MKNNKISMLFCLILFISCQNNDEKKKEIQKVEEIATKKNPTINDLEELDKIVKNSVIKDSLNQYKKTEPKDKKVELSLESLQQLKEMLLKLEEKGSTKDMSPKEKERHNEAIKKLERLIKEKTN